MGSSVLGAMGIMIPILAVVLGMGLAMLGVWLDYRKKRELFELHYRERMAALEKGVTVDPLPEHLFGKRQGPASRSLLLKGMVLLLGGGALTLAIAQSDGIGYWGLIPMAIGLAYLITFLYEIKRSKSPDELAHEQ